MKFRPEYYRSIVLIGLPVGGVILLYNLEQVLLTWIIVQQPVAVSDGFSIGLRIFGLLYMINFGISVGVSVSVGHYVGRSDYASVERDLPRFSFLATGVVTFFSFIVFILAEPVARAFTDNALSIVTAVTYLRFMMFANVGLCLIYCFNGAFEGTGKTSIILAIAIAMYLVIEFPLLLASNLLFTGQLTWIWSVIVLATMIGACTTIIAFNSGQWKVEKLDNLL